ncbi:MAG: hypothetical protein HEP71_13465 [Roseivirga sp.]|nr:hypothetical protein [Roseivirga sp.]
MWEENLRRFDKIVAMCPELARLGKTMPYTSANGHMFSLLNKAGELGFRLSKEDGEKFMNEHQTTRFKSHGAFMRGYVLIPENMFDDLELVASYLDKAHQYVLTLEPK